MASPIRKARNVAVSLGEIVVGLILAVIGIPLFFIGLVIAWGIDGYLRIKQSRKGRARK